MELSKMTKRQIKLKRLSQLVRWLSFYKLTNKERKLIIKQKREIEKYLKE